VARMTRRGGLLPAVVLLLGAAYFVIPLAATAQFSLEQGHAGFGFGAYRTILEDDAFWQTLWFSFQLALETTAITLALLVPTVIWTHLKLLRARPALEVISTLPFVIPPIVLAVGLFELFRDHAPAWFVDSPKLLACAYVILALPFVYRALDVGIRSLDIRTLVEASQSLGAGWGTTLFRVILPNLRVAVVTCAALTIAIVMGEYTIASIALFTTLPVYVNEIGTAQAFPAAALSIISIALTFAVMLVIQLAGRRTRGAR
jgi:putative spermidine/putrescine transport system permease protein